MELIRLIASFSYPLIKCRNFRSPPYHQSFVQIRSIKVLSFSFSFSFLY